MEEKKIRQQMKELWRETFGDSPEYIDLVFENNFDPEYVAYHETGDTLDSSLMGVPYRFDDSTGKTLRGLYLCGLATKKSARRQGYMSGLIEEINVRAAEKGFDFTFLIPAGEGARRYYAGRGYQDAFFKVEERYVRGHRFSREMPLEVREYDPKLHKKILDFLFYYGNEPVGRKEAFNIMHDREDWAMILKESLVSRNPVYFGLEDGKMAGVAVSEIKDNRIEIKRLVAPREKENVFLEGLTKHQPQLNISIIRNLDEVLVEGETQIWSPFYGSSNPKTAEYEDISEIEVPYDPSKGAYPFGMARILDLSALLNKVGMNKEELLKDYSEKELLTLILRRPVGKRADALEKILDLPELTLNMSLMLE